MKNAKHIARGVVLAAASLLLAGCAVTVTFAPTAAGPRAGTLIFTDDAGAQSVALTGTGTTGAPVAQVSPTSIAFGRVRVGTTSGGRTITVTNSGGANLVVGQVRLAGTNPGNFAIASSSCATVAPAASCAIVVRFAPRSRGAKVATVQILDDASGSPQQVALSGTGR